MPYPDLAITRPGATRVFLKHGLDFRCGGRRPLEEVCAEWEERARRHQQPLSGCETNLNLLPGRDGLPHRHRYESCTRFQIAPMTRPKT